MLTNSKEPGKSRSSWLRSTFQKETQLREDTIIPKREKPSLSNHKAEMPSLSPARKKKKSYYFPTFLHPSPQFPQEMHKERLWDEQAPKRRPPPAPQARTFPAISSQRPRNPTPCSPPPFQAGQKLPSPLRRGCPGADSPPTRAHAGPPPPRLRSGEEPHRLRAAAVPSGKRGPPRSPQAAPRDREEAAVRRRPRPALT